MGSDGGRNAPVHAPPAGRTTARSTAQRRLLAATWTSNVGDGVRYAALPLLAAAIDGTAHGVALVAAAGTFPFAVFGLAAGTLADRRRRVPLLFGAHLFRAGVVAVLALCLVAGIEAIAVLVIAAFALGCGEAVADSAAGALAASVTDEDELVDFTGRLQSAELVANDLVGPPLGGVLHAARHFVPYVVDTVSFLCAAAFVRSIELEESHHTAAAQRRWRDDLAEGAVTMWRNDVLRVTGGLVVLVQIGHVAAMAPIVLHITGRLGLAPSLYGFFLASGAAGGLLGARIAPLLVQRIGRFGAVVVSLALGAVAFAVLTVPSLAAAFVGYALSFAAVVIGRVVIVAARLSSVPGGLLGRAHGSIRSLVWLAATAGALVGGALAEAAGSTAPFVLAAGAYVLALAAGWRPLRRVLVDRSVADTDR